MNKPEDNETKSVDARDRADIERARAQAKQSLGSLAPPPDRIGSYEILGVIGQGGMGTVYRARQQHPARDVALKLIRPSDSPTKRRDLRRRLKEEAELLGRLQHPGIARIYEAGTFGDGENEQPFFVMELIQGRPLTKYADENKLTIRARLELFAKICDAVHHAHQKGVIHRDLKPGNILVTDDGQPKILDFGVARTTDSDLNVTTIETGMARLIGTVPYMSPEQVGGRADELDTRSDVYALGVVLYELLTGQLPYDLSQRLIHEAVRIIREDEPTRLSSHNSALRGDVDTIVVKAMEKEKDRRYQSAVELGSDVRRYLADEPIAARPPSVAYQLRKFARRHKAFVGGAVLVLVVLVAGIVTTSVARKREAFQRQLAESARQDAEENLALAERREFEAIEATEQARGALGLAKAREQEATEAQQQALIESEKARRASQDAELARSEAQDETRKKQVALERATRLETQATVRATEAEESRRRIQRLNEQLTIRTQDLDERIVMAVELRELATNRAESLRVEANRSARVRHFLENALISAAPNFKGNNLEYLTTLERLAAEFDPDEVEPALEIAVRNIIARGYASLSRYDLAQPHAQRAMTMARSVLGADHPETISAMCSMAAIHAERAEYLDAERLTREARAAAEARLDQDHPDRLRADFLEAEILADRGRYRRAESLHRNVLNRRRRAFGTYHLETVASQRALASTLFEMGDREAALSLLRNCRNIARDMLGDDAPLTLSINVDIVWSLTFEQGLNVHLFRYPRVPDVSMSREALDLIQWTVERCRNTLGRENSLTLRAYFLYLNLCIDLGVRRDPWKFPGFLEYWTDGLPILDETKLACLLRSDKPVMASILLAYAADMYEDISQFSGVGVLLLERALHNAELRLPPGHVGRAVCRLVVAERLARVEQYQRCEQILLAAVAEAERFDQADVVIQAQDLLGDIRARWSKSNSVARDAKPTSE